MSMDFRNRRSILGAAGAAVVLFAAGLGTGIGLCHIRQAKAVAEPAHEKEITPKVSLEKKLGRVLEVVGLQDAGHMTLPDIAKPMGTVKFNSLPEVVRNAFGDSERAVCAKTENWDMELQQLDLDGDGRPELLVPGLNCGSGGCDFFVFTNKGGVWYCADCAFGHPPIFLRCDDGSCGMLIYHAMGTASGSWRYAELRDRKMQTLFDIDVEYTFVGTIPALERRLSRLKIKYPADSAQK